MSVIETTLYSFGGNMETNRFEEYWESFKWADNIYTGFININHVIEVEGFIKAFEAYVTRTGCIQFLVSQSVQFFYLNTLLLLDSKSPSQLPFTCSKSTIETLKKV